MRPFELPRKVLRKVRRTFRSRPEEWDQFGIALHDHRALYLIVPKVAYSSLTALIVDLLGFKLEEGAWKPGVFRGNSFDSRIDVRARDRAKVWRRDAPKYADYWKFAFVRNPYDRLVSCYSEKIREDGPKGLFVDGVSRVLLRYGTFSRGMPFAAFAKAVSEIPDEDSDIHFRSQTAILSDERGRLRPDFVGKFERLPEDVARVGERLEARLELPHLLKSRRSDPGAYYDEETVEVVRRRYADDFRNFGYDPIPPWRREDHAESGELPGT